MSRHSSRLSGWPILMIKSYGDGRSVRVFSLSRTPFLLMRQGALLYRLLLMGVIRRISLINSNGFYWRKIRKYEDTRGIPLFSLATCSVQRTGRTNDDRTTNRAIVVIVFIVGVSDPAPRAAPSDHSRRDTDLEFIIFAGP